MQKIREIAGEREKEGIEICLWWGWRLGAEAVNMGVTGSSSEEPNIPIVQRVKNDSRVLNQISDRE